jgi:hypothetical protein
MSATAFAEHLERSQASELNKFQFVQLDKKSGKQTGNWMPGKVPGDVITDLVSALKLKHPYYDFNAKKALWVNDSDWLYQTEFTAEAGQNGGEMDRSELQVQGLFSARFLRAYNFFFFFFARALISTIVILSSLTSAIVFMKRSTKRGAFLRPWKEVMGFQEGRSVRSWRHSGTENTSRHRIPKTHRRTGHRRGRGSPDVEHHVACSNGCRNWL